MRNSSRSKALKLNALTSILSEIVTLICGLILPRVILVIYGSTTNGLVSSITQFLSFATVLRSGIGAVTRAALYKPLADENIAEISGIMSATTKYMQKVSFILAGCIFAFSIVYPFIVIDEYQWYYSFCMVLVLGITTFSENLFGIKNMILLQADQKYYIQTMSMIISQILSCLVSVGLMFLHLDMIFVKMGAAVAFFSRPLFLEIYVRRHYNINKKVTPNNIALKQRWDAFFQQFAIIINSNVDIILITLLAPLSSVSVYSIHYMIAGNISKVVQAPIQGVGSAFGDMIVKDEKANLLQSFKFMEWVVFVSATFLFSITAVMITSFVQLYTTNVNDVNYYQPVFALLMVIVVMFNCVRVPYQSIAEAAGRFKQTRNGAILEVVVHIVISVIALIYLGLIGVMIGSLISCFIRTIQYSWYSLKHVLNISPLHALKNYAIYFLVFGVTCIIGYYMIGNNVTNYFDWALYGVYSSFIVGGLVLLVSLLFNRTEVKYLLRRIIKRRSK